LLTGESMPTRSPATVDPGTVDPGAVDPGTVEPGAVEAPGHAAAPWPLDELTRRLIPRIELAIETAISREVSDPWMRAAIGYHFGWTDAEFATVPPDHRPASGKRLRPLLAILSYLAGLAATDLSAVDGPDLDGAVSFASAVELIHNFSLIHDDIQDRDRTRRGRPTLWTVCGEAQAINVGDCVQALAFACVGELGRCGVDQATVGQLVSAVARATIEMTIGQRLDVTFERMSEVDIGLYSAMIAGKTGAVMACATHGGALLAAGKIGPGAAGQAALYAEFGRQLGLCFQVRDDILGIWGNEAETGKSNAGDIRRRKKSLPIVIAMGAATGAARDRLLSLYGLSTELDDDEEREVRGILEGCAAQAISQRQAELHAELAVQALAQAGGAGADSNPFVSTLRSLTGSLTARSS
jgi:geranylgeranyl diphosphate synthase type I